MTPARPIRERVEGAPYQPGDVVRVVQAVDRPIHDVALFVGHVGVVAYLEYSCGCGQTFPDDPMIGVTFEGDLFEEFWREEVESVLGVAATCGPADRGALPPT